MDKTGEGNVMLDLTIYAQKYPKIVMQEKNIFCANLNSVVSSYKNRPYTLDSLMNQFFTMALGQGECLDMLI